jgi:hypothetical protein
MDTLIGLFKRHSDAEKAVMAFVDQGINSNKVSILTQENGSIRKNNNNGKISSETGAALGGLVGLLAGISALAVPGIGPVLATGSIANSLAKTAGFSSAVGGVRPMVGDLVGTLTKLGIPNEEAEFYLNRIKQGQVLVMVGTSAGNSDMVKEILNGAGAEDMETRWKEWQEDPEKKFFEGWDQM